MTKKLNDYIVSVGSNDKKLSFEINKSENGSDKSDNGSNKSDDKSNKPSKLSDNGSDKSDNGSIQEWWINCQSLK